ncbi:MAG: SDR family NAD(P)-dependent oxidoreductase [Gammaproteobacteria bacterium]|nr:SDR family NAD(P)-dependent oxidoreductase [Gammaproteobacteria bacterium]
MNNENRIALVTGATGAIGKAIARQIAAKPNYEAVLLCRNEDKAKRAVTEIKNATGNDKVRYELADLSRQSSILALSERWRGPVHILVNNAAITPRKRKETPEGIELQFATNVMGYFWMIQAFADKLAGSPASRVVNVASYWAGGLDLDDLEFKRRPYDNDLAYRQSKQANRMLTAAFAEKLKPVAVNACHPGDVNSTLSNNLGFGGHESPDEGASTPAWLATEPAGIEKTGKYFEHMRETACHFCKDKRAIEKLYQACLSV